MTTTSRPAAAAAGRWQPLALRLGLGWAALILVLTLTPVLAPEAQGTAGPLCFLCDQRALGDALLNVAMFVPLGLAGRWAGWSFRRTALVCIVFTFSIETLQFPIPGRDASLADPVSNSLGALLGYGLAVWTPRALFGPARDAAAALLVATVVAATVVTGTALAFAPTAPDTPYFSQWTPRFENMEPYLGTLDSVRIGGAAFPDGAVADAAPIRLAVRRGLDVELRGTLGPPTPALAPIHAVHDDAAREILLVGADRDELVVRERLLADRLHFDRPDLRFPLRPGAEAGAAFRLVVAGTPERTCVRLVAAGHPDERECRGLDPSRGWALLLYPEHLPGWVDRLLDVCWIAALVLPLALFARTVGAGGVAVGAVVLALIAAPLGTVGAGIDAAGFVGVVLGVALGVLARRGLAAWASRGRTPVAN